MQGAPSDRSKSPAPHVHLTVPTHWPARWSVRPSRVPKSRYAPSSRSALHLLSVACRLTWLVGRLLHAVSPSQHVQAAVQLLTVHRAGGKAQLLTRESYRAGGQPAYSGAAVVPAVPRGAAPPDAPTQGLPASQGISGQHSCSACRCQRCSQCDRREMASVGNTPACMLPD